LVYGSGEIKKNKNLVETAVAKKGMLLGYVEFASIPEAD